MDDDQIDDLKFFISTTVSQQTSELRQDIKKVDTRLGKVEMRLGKVEMRLGNVETGLEKLDKKVDNLSLSVGDALELSNQATGGQLKDHELRITALEKAA